MNGFLAVLATAPADRVLFVHAGAEIKAGAVRAAAARAVARLAGGDGPVFLHTDSAALLCAGLLAGATANRAVAILPHAQPAYLAEVGADGADLLTDAGDNPPLFLGQGDDAAIPSIEDSRLLFFTSGSTGAPKQVPKRMSQLDAEVRHWASAFGGRIDHVAGTVSHQHIYGMTFRVILPVLAGWRSQDRQAFTWESFALEIGQRSLAVTSPAHLSRIPPELDLANGAPGIVLSAGQLLPLPAAQEAARRFGAPALEILGSTETGAVATRQRADDPHPWTPLSEVDVSADEDGALLARSSFIGGDAQRMGDLIDLLPDGRFHLRGRADRVVKIDGKRISLTRIEEALKATKEIADATAISLAADAGEVLGAIVMPTPEGGAELARLGAFRFSRKLRAALADRLEPAERPKRWRFIGSIPANAQGKRTAADLAALFETGSILEMLNASVELSGSDQAKVRFFLAPDLRWFEGHFPGRPVLAGVAQTHLAQRVGEELWGFLPGSFQVTRLKFRRMIRPSEQIVLALARDIEKRRLVFSFTTDGEPASEGVIGP